MLPTPLPARAHMLRQACDACYAQHRSCDGAVPACAYCVRRSIPCRRSTRRRPGPAPKLPKQQQQQEQQRVEARPESVLSLPLDTDVFPSAAMAACHLLYTAAYGALFAGANVASVATALRARARSSDATERAEKLLAIAIVAWGARKWGDPATSAEACRRASEMPVSSHPVAAVAHAVLGMAAVLAGDRAMAEGYHRLAYTASGQGAVLRRETAAAAAAADALLAAEYVAGGASFPAWSRATAQGDDRLAEAASGPRGVLRPETAAAAPLLDVVHVVAGAHLVGLARSAAEVVAVSRECEDAAPDAMSRTLVRLALVRHSLVKVLGSGAPDVEHLSDLCTYVGRLAEDTIAAARAWGPASGAVRVLCQNYLSVQAVTLLLLGDRPAAGAAAHCIVRATAEQPPGMPVPDRVLPLTCALAVFMDLGMPDDVASTLRRLGALQQVNAIATEILDYAHTGRRPAGAAASDGLELVLLDTVFRPRRQSSGPRAPPELVHSVVRLEDALDWDTAPHGSLTPAGRGPPLSPLPPSAAPSDSPLAWPEDWGLAEHDPVITMADRDDSFL